jgi:hypothetical protein
VKINRQASFLGGINPHAEMIFLFGFQDEFGDFFDYLLGHSVAFACS